MTLTTPTRRAAALALLLATVLGAGCAAFGPDKPPEVVVRERAALRWNSLIAGEMEKAYGLLPPSYRAVTPLANWRATFQGAVKWTAAEVAYVKCETADKCVAHMKVDSEVRFPRPTPLTNYFDETWVRQDGQWWLFPTP